MAIHNKYQILLVPDTEGEQEGSSLPWIFAERHRSSNSAVINYGVVTLINEPKSSPIISSVYGPNYLFFNQFIEKLSFVCFCYDKCQLVKNVSAIFINSVILSFFFFYFLASQFFLFLQVVSKIKWLNRERKDVGTCEI